MEPEGSLPSSQGPATCPYPESHEFRPHVHTLFLSDQFLMLSSHLLLGLPNDLFLSDFPSKILYALFIAHSCYMFHPPYYRWFHEASNIWRKVHIMKLLIMQFSPAASSLLAPNILLSTLFLKPSVCVLPLVWDIKTHVLAK